MICRAAGLLIDSSRASALQTRVFLPLPFGRGQCTLPNPFKGVSRNQELCGSLGDLCTTVVNEQHALLRRFGLRFGQWANRTSTQKTEYDLFCSERIMRQLRSQSKDASSQRED